jgi:NAD(P)-dependent dehydrogenase (short-subunit alcohol dehydrogenase family)
VGRLDGKTALISGSARGQGEAHARLFAEEGARVLVSDLLDDQGEAVAQDLSDQGFDVRYRHLDVRRPSDWEQAVAFVEREFGTLDILINNAGIALYDDLSDRAVLERHLAVNLFGTYAVTQAFLPLLTRSRGAIVNVLSVTALAALPLIPAYSISKAAAFSLTQSLRALLAGRGVTVHAALIGPVDTDMSRGLDIPKASPESVARAIFDGVEKGEEEIFPDPMSASIAESWRSGAAKALERQFAAFVAENVKS